MFAYLRSHTKRAAQQSPPVDRPAPDFHTASSQHPQQSRLPELSTFVHPPGHRSYRDGQENNQDDAEDQLSPLVSTLPPTLPPIPRIASVYGKVDGLTSPPLQSPYSPTEHGKQPSYLHYQPTSPSKPISPTEPQVLSPVGVSASHPASQQFGQAVGTGRAAEALSKTTVERGPSTSSTASTGVRTKGQTTVSGHRSRNSVESTTTPVDPSYKYLPPPPISGPLADAHTARLSPSIFPADSHRTPPMPIVKSPTQTSIYQPNIPPRTFAANSTDKRPEPSLTSKKSKGRLRNPMSRLLRRKNVGEAQDLPNDSFVAHREGTNLPANFDPSIRGKVVHDFSAPRPKRFPSDGSVISPTLTGHSDVSSGREYRQGSYESSKPEIAHTPVFRENFDDNDEIEDSRMSTANVRAEELANQDFVKRHSQTLDKALPLPPFARTPPSPNSSTSPGSANSVQKTSGHDTSPTIEFPSIIEPPRRQSDEQSASMLATVVEDEDDSSLSLDASKSTSPPPASRSRAASRASMGDFQPAGLPAHMNSRSSRFSFQLVGSGSQAQEKLLEDRHIQKRAEKEQSVKDSNTPAHPYDDEEDDFDYDDMDLEGMEDDVPVSGDDWEYNGAGSGVRNMTLSTMGMSLPNGAMALNKKLSDGSNPRSSDEMTHGLGIFSSFDGMPVTDDSEHQEAYAPRDEAILESDTRDSSRDDLYFDDGEIGDNDFDYSEDQPFDESMFDDPSSALYERRQPVKPIFHDSTRTSQEIEEENKTRTVAPQNSRRAKRSFLPGDLVAPVLGPSDAPELMGNMPAWHQRLAEAATQAAADGRFNRKESVDTLADATGSATRYDEPNADIDDDGDDGYIPSSRSSLVPDESRTSKATTNFSPTQLPPYLDVTDPNSMLPMSKGVLFDLPPTDNTYVPSHFDMSDYDSAMGDDPMIAAANAEALAYDEEGDYGREFGFYARPAPNGQASLKDADTDAAIFSNGGYFGPKDWSEVKRQRSTREPNLTPITERSEFSTRNSFIGVGNMSLSSERGRSVGFATANQSSPGLAALASMSSPSWDGDLNLTSYLRLRNRTFNGSQSSLNSGGGSSPLASSPANAMPYTSSPSYLQPGSRPGTGHSPMSREVGFPSPYSEDSYDNDSLIREANMLSEEDEDEFDEGLERARIVSSGLSIDDFNSPSSQYSFYRTSNPPASGYVTEALRYQKDYPMNTESPSLDYIEEDEDADLETSEFPDPPSSVGQPTVLTQLDPNATPRRPRATKTEMDITPRPSKPTLQTNTTIASNQIYLPSPTSPTKHTNHHPSHPLTVEIPSSPQATAAASAALVSPISQAAFSPSSSMSSPKRHGHRRKGSDSVAYVQELDERSGDVRWVLERRRTAEDGALVLLGREVVEGGRI